jgi:hypothetical protein
MLARSIAAVMVVLVSAGCAPSASTCVMGMSVACACSDGRSGAQSCRFGAFGPCVCDGVDGGALDAGAHDAALADAMSMDDASAPIDSGVDAFSLPDGGAPVIDLGAAVVHNSPPDVATWAETATITTLDLNLDGVFIDFTKRDGPESWPDVPFVTPGEDLEYTLWIVLFIDGQWHTSGCIQYWRGLDRNGGEPSGYAEHWYYDAGRWGVMTGHQPAVGEWVGFFVTAGNARNVTDGSGSTVYERSNVVVVPFPADPGAVFTY